MILRWIRKWRIRRRKDAVYRLVGDMIRVGILKYRDEAMAERIIYGNNIAFVNQPSGNDQKDLKSQDGGVAKP